MSSKFLRQSSHQVQKMETSFSIRLCIRQQQRKLKIERGQRKMSYLVWPRLLGIVNRVWASTRLLITTFVGRAIMTSPIFNVVLSLSVESLDLIDLIKGMQTYNSTAQPPNRMQKINNEKVVLALDYKNLWKHRKDFQASPFADKSTKSVSSDRNAFFFLDPAICLECILKHTRFLKK